MSLDGEGYETGIGDSCQARCRLVMGCGVRGGLGCLFRAEGDRGTHRE